MDDLKNRINGIVESIGRPQLIRYVMLYMLIVGVVSLCGGVLLFVGGAVAGLGGAASAAVLSQASGTDAQQAAAASAGLAGASIFLTLYGLLSIIVGPAMIVVGLGLRSRAKWSRMGVVIILSLQVLSSLIGLFTGGGGILSLVWIIVDIVVVYVFYSDPAMKAEFGG